MPCIIVLSFQCGGAYTSKLEGMLNDFILADVMNKDFQPDFAAWRDKEDNQELVRENLDLDIGDETSVIVRHCLSTTLS